MISKYELKTKFYFGKQSILKIRDEVIQGKFKKALILYGGGSIKKIGLFDSLVEILKSCNIDFEEYGGITPNPRDTDVYDASKFVRDNNIDLIIAAGGGSVVDASKVIAILANNPQFPDAWSYVMGKGKATRKAIPIFSIITLAGTGSENNAGSVITNEKLQEKFAVFTPSAIPLVTIEDPDYTISVDRWNTASGIFDCFSHLLEQYYGEKTFDWTKEIIFANLRVLLKHAEKAVRNPMDYDARANILWTTSMSLNGTTSFQSDTDWTVHSLEHAISGKWDVTHGAGLALITPTYIKLRSEMHSWFKEKTIVLAKEVFGIKSFDEFIDFLNNWIRKIGLPIKWTDFSEIKLEYLTDKNFDDLVNHTIKRDSFLPKEFYKKVFESIPK